MLPKAQLFLSNWIAEIRHEWLRSRIPSVQNEVFALPVLYLVELHDCLQVLLLGPGTDLEQKRVLTRLIGLRGSPHTEELSGAFQTHGRALARTHSRPIRFCGERHSSFTHALMSHCGRTFQLFGTAALCPETSDQAFSDFLENRKAAFDAFLAGDALSPEDRRRKTFFVTVNNWVFCGSDLHSYADWLSRHKSWDFRASLESSNREASTEPMTVKQLMHSLKLSDTTLLTYRKKAGLKSEGRGKRVLLSPDDIIILCNHLERSSPNANEATRQRASELKSKYLPDSKKSH